MLLGVHKAIVLRPAGTVAEHHLTLAHHLHQFNFSASEVSTVVWYAVTFRHNARRLNCDKK